VGYPVEWMSKNLKNEWREKYISKIIEIVDYETHFHPWLYFGGFSNI
jgi:hypothetical protein